MNYQDILNASIKRQIADKKLSNFLASIRLILFILLGISFYFLHKSDYQSIGILGLVTLLVLFLLTIKHHQKIEKRIEYQEITIKVCKQELLVLENGINLAFDGGEEYRNSSHYFSFDLDIFGQKSIFQLLNRTFTQGGKNLLAKNLQSLFTNTETIKNRQDSIAELKQNAEWRINFLTLGNLLEENQQQFETLTNWLKKEPTRSFEKYKYLLWLTPTLNLLIFFALLSSFISFEIFGLCLFLQTIIWGANRKEINELHDKIQRQATVLDRYNELFIFLEKSSFRAILLKNQQNFVKNIANEIRSLSKIIRVFQMRNNVFGFPFYIMLYGDLATSYRFEQWKKANADALLEAFKALYHMEELVSIASFAYTNAEYVMPEMNADSSLNGTKMGHPLIRKEQRITNDFEINTQFYIVTGANMAGKSTFLRTLGVNLVLAMMGSPVCAEKFIFKPVQVFTCMRISDSITEGESYFHAELARLAKIIEEAKQDKNLFIILDELLKGTNSKDKLMGSELYIEQLLQYKNCTGLIATHDLELTKMATKYPSQIKNICFEVLIENQQMVFDYLLKDGITQNMNALFLMKQMGII